MITTLKYFQRMLNLRISTACKYLRSMAYAQKSEEQYNTMATMVYHQILVDELNILLHSHSQVVDALTKFLKGEDYNTNGTDTEPLSIYDYCLSYFQQDDVALGQVTSGLTDWVATFADQQQAQRKVFRSYFPGIGLDMGETNEEGVLEFRSESEAKQFEADTANFLRDIETSNALAEFNQQMQSVKLLLEKEAPVSNVLVALTETSL